MERGKKRHAWWALAALGALTLPLALVLYVGAYRALVRPLVAPLGIVPGYAVKDEWKWVAYRCFAHIHDLDRKLRPDVWH